MARRRTFTPTPDDAPATHHETVGRRPTVPAFPRRLAEATALAVAVREAASEPSRFARQSSSCREGTGRSRGGG